MRRLVCVAVGVLWAVGCGSSESKRAAEEIGAAKAAMNRGGNETALEHLDTSIGIKPTAEAYLLRSRIHMQQSKIGLAMDDVDAGLDIEPAEQELLDQKLAIETTVRELQASLKANEERAKRYEQERIEREREQAEQFATSQREHEARESRQRLMDDLRFVLTGYEDYWSKATDEQREAYIAGIAANGEGRISAEIAGRKAYWNDRYLSEDEPGSLDDEEAKAKQYVADYLENNRPSK